MTEIYCQVFHVMPKCDERVNVQQFLACSVFKQMKSY